MKEVASVVLPPISDGCPTSEHSVENLPSSDGQALACRIWPGQGAHEVQSHEKSDRNSRSQAQARPVILYLHGIEGHSQWFANTAAVLSRLGITVYAPDRRGAGLNRGERGHLKSYKTYLADIEVVLQTITNRHPQSSIVLMGNCWGAKAAVTIASSIYVRQTGDFDVKISGLILTSPALYTKPDFDWFTKAKIGYSSLIGGGRELNELPIPLSASMFTDDAVYLEFIEHDPMRLKSATCRFYFETFMLTRKALSCARHLRLPTLVIQSGKDEVVRAEAVERWFEREKLPNWRFKMFRQSAHSIDFDRRCFDEYAECLSGWLDSLELEPASGGNLAASGKLKGARSC